MDADGNYLPGPKILSLAGMALQRIDISASAQPFVDELVAKSRCTIHLGVVNGEEIIYLIRADSDRPYVMPSRVGLAIPMHCTAIGKVVLASRSDDEEWNAWSNGPVWPPGRSTRSPRCTGCAPRSRTCAGTVKYGVSITTLLIEHTPEQIEAMSGLAVETADKVSAALGCRA